MNLEKRTREDGDGGQFAAPVASGAPSGAPRGGGGDMNDPDLDDLPF